jgi:DNA-binding response OmpR family regulator
MRLLIIEDSHRLRTSLEKGLSACGYSVDSVGCGRAGFEMAQASAYDLIILDLMLSGMDGLSLLQNLRKRGCQTHILILSAKDRVEHRVEGLQAGADDYLVKPFAFEELLARVGVLVRRAHGCKTSQLEFPNIVVDLTRRRVTAHNQRVDLTPREYSLLEYLALDAGRPVSRQELESHLYSSSEVVASNVIDSTVAALRRKLGELGVSNVIHTRRGIGYEFCSVE